MGVAMRISPTALSGNRTRALGFAAAFAMSAYLFAPASAQTPPPTVAYESAQSRYAVTLPAGCRQDEGPGTLDAVCAPDFDAERSAKAPVALSLVLEVTAERLAKDGASPASAPYTAQDFRDELADTICSVADRNKVKIENVEQKGEADAIVFSALVTCPEMKFLGYPERRASARTIATPDMRYRLFGRATSDQFEPNKQVIESFLSSFRVLPPSN